MADKWLAEAVVDFLRGPLYINPLMGFIDQKCLIFTTEDENKLEYTPIHEEFKDLVDALLTEFIEELGVSGETFYEVMNAQGQDKLTGFVVQTILTVDDFTLFKAMMVKRNIDLTNQVLDKVDEIKREAAGCAQAEERARDAMTRAEANAVAQAQGAARNKKELESQTNEAIKISTLSGEIDLQRERLMALMRSLQLEDEDVALAIAITNSLRDQARADTEAADINQAIALSEALANAAEEQAKSGKPTAPPPKTESANAPAAFPEPPKMSAEDAAMAAAIAASMGGPAAAASSCKATSVDPLSPLNIGANNSAAQMAAVAAAAEANAQRLGQGVPARTSIPSAAMGGGSSSSQGWAADDAVSRASAGVAGMSVGGAASGGGGSSGASVVGGGGGGASSGGGSGGGAGSSLAGLPPVGGPGGGRGLGLPAVRPPTSGQAPPPSIGQSGGLSVGATAAAATAAMDPFADERSLAKQNSMGYARHGAGFKGDRNNDSTRDAAEAAAIAQRGHIVADTTGSKSSANVWMEEQKRKLIALKAIERDAEMNAFVAAAPSKPADSMEAKREALRAKLAAKFKNNNAHGSS
ncbi:hypothetical protein FOA52_008521 [Chlamydomonas sp. UWO 241]|nr:hypothetical protein FOA52_008521 [Chlamydomonas sp. UWO 241]